MGQVVVVVGVVVVVVVLCALSTAGNDNKNVYGALVCGLGQETT